MRQWIAALVVVFGCGAPASPTPAAAPEAEVPSTSTAPAAESEEAPPALTIDVTFEADADRWRARYTFAEPVGGMVFPRNRHLFRAKSGWRLETPGTRWDEQEAHEVVVIEGEPRREVALSFATNTDNREKDYKLNLDFSEGSRLLYTGHLNAQPLAGANGLIIAWRVHAPGQRVVALDAVGEGELRWSRPEVDERGGTYVYVGSIAPLRTERLTAIVDPGLPKGMRDSTLGDLPKLFDWYTERIGHGLDFKPLVLASFRSTGSGRNLKGGTLTGLVQLDAGGAGWLKGDHQDHWFHFLSHEAFHLWNGQQFPKRGDRTEEWLSEGSSDLYAARAQRHFGYLDDHGFAQTIVEAANRCLLQAGQAPLLGPKLPYGTYYACGAVYLHVLDADLKRAGSSLDQALGRMWARSKKTDGYATADLLFEVQRVTGDATSLGWLTTALYEGLAEPAAETLAAWLKRAGNDTRLVSPEKADVTNKACRQAIMQQLRACGCGYSVKHGAAKIEVRLRGCSDQALASVGGHSLASAPCEALGALHRARMIPSCAPRSTPVRLLRAH
jgi:hypothetical protein